MDYMSRWQIARELKISVQHVKAYDGRGLTPLKAEDGWRVRYERKEVEAFIAAYRPRQRPRRRKRRQVYPSTAKIMATVARLAKEGKSLRDIAIEVPCDPAFLLECYRLAKVPEDELLEERERERHEEAMERKEQRHAQRLYRLRRTAALSVSAPKPEGPK